MPPPDGSLRGLAPTQALLGDYSSTFSDIRATPLRTPVQENIILQEARNLRILRDFNPLIDSQNNVEQPALVGGFGFDGVDPRASRLATPNTVLSSPLTTSASLLIPDSRSISLRQSVTTPGSVLRDKLGSNHSDPGFDTASVISSVADSQITFTSKIRDKELRALISAQLKALPEPEYIYDIAIPEMEKEPEQFDIYSSGKPADAADVLANIENERAERIRRDFACQSSVIKRNLPRPINCSVIALQYQGMSEPNLTVPSTMLDISAMINDEMVKLIGRDAYHHPETNAASDRARPLDIPDIDDDLLSLAREQILKELTVLEQMSVYGGPSPLSSFEECWEEVHRGLICVPQVSKSRKAGSVSKNVPEFVMSTTLTTNEVLGIVAPEKCFIQYLSALFLFSWWPLLLTSLIYWKANLIKYYIFHVMLLDFP